MKNKDKILEYDKMVGIISQHYIESDGIFAQQYTLSAILDDCLDRYLYTIKYLQNKLKQQK